MRTFSVEEEKDSSFFDAREEISSVSDWGSDCSGNDSPGVVFNSNFQYKDWIKHPDSVKDRRRRFLRWMGLSSSQNDVAVEELGDESCDKIRLGVDRLMDDSGTVLRNSGSEHGFLSTQSSVSFESNEASQRFENGMLDGKFVCKIKNLDDGKEFVVDELDEDGMLCRLHEVGSNQSFSFEEFRRTLGTSPLVERFMKKYVDDGRDVVEAKRKAKRSWLKKLGLVGKIVDRQGTDALMFNGLESSTAAWMQRVKVHPSKKHTKELSSLYTGQEFPAHNGSILTMKFSLDGQYLASGGEDGVVRVWKVIEDDRSNHIDIPASDPSCLYFTVNDLSELAFVDVDKKKVDKMKRHGTSDSTCVVFPPKVFRVLEKPLHEFEGHSGEVLDLSWSKKRVSTIIFIEFIKIVLCSLNGCALKSVLLDLMKANLYSSCKCFLQFLLSSSVDKTVRLWQVGCDRCLRIFLHNNYGMPRAACLDLF